MGKDKKKTGPQPVTDQEWLTYLNSLNTCYVKVELMKTKRGKAVAEDIINKFNGFQRWANNKINTLNQIQNVSQLPESKN